MAVPASPPAHSASPAKASPRASHAAYSCGVLLSLALHERLGGGDRDGLYALWRELVRPGPGDLEARYLGLIAEVGGQALADRVRAVVRDRKPDFEALR